MPYKEIRRSSWLWLVDVYQELLLLGMYCFATRCLLLRYNSGRNSVYYRQKLIDLREGVLALACCRFDRRDSS